MRTFLILAVVSSLMLGACSGWRDARVNPSNWFGGGGPAPVPASADTAATLNPLIPENVSVLQRDRRETYDGTTVTEIVEIALERTSTGGILRVTGVTARQGAFDVRLVNDTDGEPVDGVLRYSLRAFQPTEQGIGSTTARTVRAGLYLSSNVLERTSRIEVAGTANSLSTAVR